MSASTLAPAPPGALLGVYRPQGPVFVAGEGSWLIDEEGGRYLDFTSGIGVCALGHGHAAVTSAIADAARTGLVHTSNLFRTAPAGRLAEWLVEHSFAASAFFCNSGAEANEAVLKFARRWAGPERPGIVAFRGGFHGRTAGALSLTDRPAIRDPFLPLVPGVHFCEVGDADEVERVLAEGRTAAVLIEPVQGEGGVRPVPPAFLRELRALCDRYDVLLAVDEVQTGLGRTGEMWGYEHAGIEPDLLSVAKPLAGGLPMGAVLLSDRVAEAIRPGDHATTFGGGPLVAAAALAVCETVAGPGFLEGVRTRAARLEAGLQALAGRHPRVTGVRGIGMMWGVEVAGDAGPVIAAALERGLLLCTAGTDVVRLLPPLTASAGEIDMALDILEDSL
jgi:predicted acetylornithine/succinylornithine family transaminase